MKKSVSTINQNELERLTTSFEKEISLTWLQLPKLE